MSEPIEAFPLQWPLGRPRSKMPQRAQFKLTFGSALSDLQREARMLGAAQLVVSTNLPLRRDGMPMANRSPIGDPGVAVYFSLKGRAMCFACDRWDKVESNIRAIGKTIEALRGIERWGSGSMVEQAFAGFTALPAPEQAWQTLGLSSSRPTREQIDEAHRRLASKHHPDKGGDSQEMGRINAARDELYRGFQQ